MAPFLFEDNALLPKDSIEYAYLVVLTATIGIYLIRFSNLRSEFKVRMKAKPLLMAEQVKR